MTLLDLTRGRVAAASPLAIGAACGLLTLTGCPHPERPSRPDHGSDAGTPLSVSGRVTRSTPSLGPGEDGVGTLFIAGLSECRLGAPLLASAFVTDADLAAHEARVPFAMELPSPATLYLAAFLDDDLNADPQAPQPDSGDLVLAEGTLDGVLTCVEVRVDHPVRRVHIDLNAIRP